MTKLADDKRVVRVKANLAKLACLPNKELLALNELAQKLIDGLKDGDKESNLLRFELGALLLRGKTAAKSDRHYLAWCKTLGLQPRTAQNYARMAGAFGDCHRPFCDLKTTTIYRLAAADEKSRAGALAAAAEGSLTAAKAASLLRSAPKEKPSGVSPTTGRFVSLVQSFMPDLRSELIELLAGVNLKEALALLKTGPTIFATKAADQRPLEVLHLDITMSDQVPA